MKNEGERRLTVKQRRWIKAYIKTGNATQAAKDAKYKATSNHSFEQIGYENLRKLETPDLMENMGLTDVTLMNIGIEGMTEAKKIHGTGDNFVEIPDYAVRHKYWDTMLKLKKRLGDDSSKNGININNSKVLIVPSELVTKYEIPSDTEHSSTE